MMKKVASLIMFIFLAMVGYYIGEAVAQNNTAEPAAKQTQNQIGDNVGGVLVMEEYDAVAVPVSAKDTKTAVGSQTDNKANQLKQLNQNNAAAEVIEESVSETETAD